MIIHSELGGENNDCPGEVEIESMDLTIDGFCTVSHCKGCGLVWHSVPHRTVAFYAEKEETK